jgi:neutral ceramidase
MRVGYFKVNITPPLGMDMAGYAKKRKAKEILDDLFSSAIVIEQNGVCTAIVGVDVLAISAESVAAIRAIVETETSIPGQNILIAASHTHTGPSTVEIFNSKPEPAWMSIFEGQVASSIILAWNRLKEARLIAGVGEDDHFIFNRRLLNQNNHVEMTLDQNLTDLNLIPESGVDPSVNTLLLTDVNGEPIAIIVNFANHLDIPTGDRFSADYPGVMTRTIQSILGEQVGVVFLNGCCGDIEHLNPFDNKDISTRERYYDSKGIEKMERYGTILGCEVVRTVLAKESEIIADSILAEQKILQIPIRTISQATLEWSNLVQSHPDGCTNRESTMAKEALLVHELRGTKVAVELQVIVMGAIAIIGIPAEVFVDIGLKIKEKSPFQFTFVSELSNGWVGYLPTERAFAHGGYETIPARSSKLIESADCIIIDGVLDLLTEMKEKQYKGKEVLQDEL